MMSENNMSNLLELTVLSDGTKEYRLNGLVHRDDGPAVVWADGTIEEWFFHGHRHREDGPAITRKDGYESWWKNGKIHRDDGGPSITDKNGNQFWHFEGALHRDGLPAIVMTNGYLEWWDHGLFIKSNSYQFDEKNIVSDTFDNESSFEEDPVANQFSP
jgi:hypothetical protein